jgi:hypothetical protein
MSGIVDRLGTAGDDNGAMAQGRSPFTRRAFVLYCERRRAVYFLAAPR